MEDPGFPWHCTCDVESSAYHAPIPAPDPEEQISDRIAWANEAVDPAANEGMRLRLESTLLRDERLLKTYQQPRAVLEQMKECGVRTRLPGSEADVDQSNSDTEFFNSVD